MASADIELWLLRHAKAERPEGIDDFDRPLSESGKKDAKKLGEWMLENNLIPEFILCSRAKRTQQTLKRLTKNWPLARQIPTLYLDSLYLVEAQSLLGQIKNLAAKQSRILLVGHNDGLEQLLNLLTPAHEQLLLMPTCAFARIHSSKCWSDLAPAWGQLLQLVTPKTLPQL